jgi:HSP20 family protein
MNQLRRQMDELLAGNLGFAPWPRPFALADSLEPPFDIYETDDRFRLYASLPGYTAQDIQIEATPDSIQLSGERKPLHTDEKAVPHRQNQVTTAGRFQFRFTPPVEIDPDRITASYTDGVLQVELPKTEAARPKSIRVQVENRSG